MLPKRLRVSKQTIEKHLLRSRRLKTSRFLVLYTQIASHAHPQVSFSASKKIAPKAVLRNKLRRRGYAALLPLIPFLSPTTVMLVSYITPDSKISLAEIREELKKAFIQARIYTE
jgi:ribonuclease P protein component